MQGYLVTEEIRNCQPKWGDKFYLVPGDLIVQSTWKGAAPNTWQIEAPGPAISGIILTEEQVATLHEVEYEREHLTYWFTRDEDKEFHKKLVGDEED